MSHRAHMTPSQPRITPEAPAACRRLHLREEEACVWGIKEDRGFQPHPHGAGPRLVLCPTFCTHQASRRGQWAWLALGPKAASQPRARQCPPKLEREGRGAMQTRHRPSHERTAPAEFIDTDESYVRGNMLRTLRIGLHTF